jgi:hypothetical protein
LWNELLKNYNIKIHFAHRTFNWCNEARGNAHVHCVIIGFANFDTAKKRLFDYEDIKGEPHEIQVKNINPYLIDYDDFVIMAKSNPICDVNPIIAGGKLVDGGHLILHTEEEKNDFINREPNAEKYIHELIGAEEYINGEKRWCLWLKGANPQDIAKMPLVIERINKVKEMRMNSKKIATQKLANTPSLFAEIKDTGKYYLLIPLISSEKRKYIPIGFFDKKYIPTNRCSFISNATLCDFGILSSEMHMTWTKYVCGRLESRYRYSASIVYNNFPFPKDVSEKNKQNVEQKAQAVLDVRAKYQNTTCHTEQSEVSQEDSSATPQNDVQSCSLAVLYNPETMPPDLMKAHQELDRAVDKCYGKTSFQNERERIEFLFALYEQYTKPLLNQ